MPHKKPEIERIEITPNDDGTLQVEIRHRMKKSSDGKMNPDYSDCIEKLGFSSSSALGKYLDELFPISMTQSEGKTNSQRGGGSRLDTYESPAAESN